MRILIVEDNDISAGILESNLQQRHYETVVASTGTEALKMLETYWDIGLVIADIMVPEMDGLELVRHMREDPIWQDMPVIICTSLADSEHVGIAAKLGCRHYLLKPIDRVKLLMMVEKLLSGKKLVPVLGEHKQIAAQYGLSTPSLIQILKAFSQLVDESITTLTSNPSGIGRPEIVRLAEGAVTLGAERLLMPVHALQATDSATIPAEKSGALLVELKLIQRALEAQLKTFEPVVEAGKAAAVHSADDKKQAPESKEADSKTAGKEK
jgi:CheY-like chemotaxis protein